MIKYFRRGLNDDVGSLSLVMGTIMASAGLVMPCELGFDPNSIWVIISTSAFFLMTVVTVGFLAEREML
jgi:hypothetical protein